MNNAFIYTSTPQVFSDAAPFRANLRSMNTLATSMVGYCPLIRHLFHWLNGVPASRKVMYQILAKGGSVAVIPGGESSSQRASPGAGICSDAMNCRCAC